MQNYAPTPAPIYVTARKTSKLGKASLLIAVIIFGLVVASIVLLIVLLQTQSRPETVVLGVMIIGWFFAPGGHFIGLILGIIDVCRSRSKKLVPALGIAGNAILGGIGIAILFSMVSLFLKSAGGFH